MALSITPSEDGSRTLTALCEELRAAAGLQRAREKDLPLEVVFVVPYKGMAVEGYYFPAGGSAAREELVPGNGVARQALNRIVPRAGVPPRLLEETDVEHEISCEIKEPAWLIRWEDVRLVNGEAPETVIDRAHQRFMAIHQSVVEHGMGVRPSADPLSYGSDRPVPRLVAKRSAPVSRVVP